MIAQARKTDGYYQHTVSNTSLLLTDGVNTIRQRPQLRSLFDSILFYQKDARIDPDYQVWKLQRRTKGWLLTCSDQNHKVSIVEDISFLEYSQASIMLLVKNNVCMLPTEHA